ncbi:hypothetical protein AB0J57_17990 [Streptomyces sp. NPDC049837]|uniref:hypothetical protein n=1 Tax=Streptomyces sp. NPDC049837 TaxID=3155277 RepID=UPI00343BEFB6
MLVVTDGQPPVEAVRTALMRMNVPVVGVDVRDGSRPLIDDRFLSDTVAGVPRAKFQAVVLPDENPFGAGSAEMASLERFERRFDIRQLDASVRPKPEVGLVGMHSDSFDGTARLTAGALAADFAYARGPVPFEEDDPNATESRAEIARPLAGFRPLVTAQARGGGTGALAGVFTHDGREELVLTFDYNEHQPQFQVLIPGLVRWLTKGVHLGYERSYFAVHIDDVFLPNARWMVGQHCTQPVDCPVPARTPLIRMTAEDVTYAVAWQRENRFRLDFAFNGLGSTQARIRNDGTDPLTDALLAHKGSFGWINHTWSHRYLGCVQDRSVTPWRCAKIPVLGDVRYVSQKLLEAEIEKNIDFADRYDLPINPAELVTGEHSGLRAKPQMPEDNPNLAAALTETGVRTIASDASLEKDQRDIGGTRTLPRYPIDLGYDTATVAEAVDQYSWLHTAKADGGSGECERTDSCIAPLDRKTGFTDYIVPSEARRALGHMLSNDPRPHYLHQSNLAEDRTAYPIIERALARYRHELIRENRPVLVPSMTEADNILARQKTFHALAAGEVTAWIQGGVVTVQTDRKMAVPLTAPEGTRTGSGTGPLFGQQYGGERSAWTSVSGEGRYTLPPRR